MLLVTIICRACWSSFGVEQAQQMLARYGISGIELARGVEDEKAFDVSFHNQVTANGLVNLFRVIQEGRGLLPESAAHMVDLLFAQEFGAGIPAGLPAAVRQQARVANKTGEISTAAHDAGLVFLPDRQPYALCVLTEPDSQSNNRFRRDIDGQHASLPLENLLEHLQTWGKRHA